MLLEVTKHQMPERLQLSRFWQTCNTPFLLLLSTQIWMSPTRHSIMIVAKITESFIHSFFRWLIYTVKPRV
jgi:hypothetical protein